MRLVKPSLFTQRNAHLEVIESPGNRLGEASSKAKVILGSLSPAFSESKKRHKPIHYYIRQKEKCLKHA